MAESHEWALKTAHERRRAGAFEEAGDYYSFEAYTSIGRSEFHEYEVGAGVAHMLYAVICYRLAGNEKRAENRCRQTVLVLEDLRESILEADIAIGLAYEFEGDVRLLGGLGEHEAAYGQARSHYEAAEATRPVSNVIAWMGEESHASNSMFLRRLATSIDWELSTDTLEEITNRSPVSRVEFKQAHLGEMVDELLDSGKWVWKGDETPDTP